MMALGVAAIAVGKITFSRLPSTTVRQLASKAEPTPSVLPPSPTPFVLELVLGDFYYPGAKTTRLSGSKVYLKSTDEVEKITSWYKTKISALKMNLRNFVQTNTNGSFSHQLTAADEKEKIEVLINRGQGEKETEITVSISRN